MTNNTMSPRNPMLAMVLGALFALPSTGSAQIGYRAGGGIAFESYSFGDADVVGIESISLLTVPIQASVAFTPRITLDLNGAYASGSMTRTGADAVSVAGPTDTELRLNYTFGTDAVVLTAIAMLPTGLTELTTDEADLAGAIAADVLPFHISNFGTGGGFGVSSAVAVPLGDVAAGLSVGYVLAGEYSPNADDSFTYRPGNQLHVRAALDRNFGSSGKAALQLAFQTFQDDQLDGKNLYRSGDRLEAIGSYSFAAGPQAAAVVYLGYLRRGEGEFEDIVRIVPAQDMLFTGAGMRLPWGGGVLAPSIDIRLISREDGNEEGYSVTAGVTAEWPFRRVIVVPTIRGRLGDATVRPDASSGFTGIDVGLGVRFGAAR